MGIVLDTVDPRQQAPRRQANSGDDGPWRSLLLSALAIALLGLGARFVLVEPSSDRLGQREDPTATSIDPNTAAFAQSDAALARPDELVPYATGESLVLISPAGDQGSSASGLELDIIDLRTAKVTQAQAPEVLLDREPLAITGSTTAGSDRGGLVVIGVTGAWFGERSEAGFNWTFLGPADLAKASSVPQHVWLRRDVDGVATEDEPPADGRFVWVEVDVAGQVSRTLFRNIELAVPTPELSIGQATGIFRLANKKELGELGLPADEIHWRPMSLRGTVVAIGPNDLVVSECATFLECERVWYDAVSGTALGGLFGDLAEGLNPRFVGLLSSDARFMASESDNSMTQITSVGTQTNLKNECSWGRSIAWSKGSELLACLTADGVELYDTTERRSLGLVSERPGELAWAVFTE